MRRLVLMLVLLVASAACSPDDQRGALTPAASDAVVVDEDDESTPTSVDAEPPSSTATIGVVDDVIDLDVTCYAPGAGDLVAVGVGESPEGVPVDLLVQAIRGEPYVSIGLGDRLIESSLESPLLLMIDNGVITGEQVALVENLDLVTGSGDELGLGFVHVDCRQFASGLPPGY